MWWKRGKEIPVCILHKISHWSHNPIKWVRSLVKSIYFKNVEHPKKIKIRPLIEILEIFFE